jgi:site-specific DNA-adenine methylase
MITAKEFQELYIDEDLEITLDESLQVSFGEWENQYKDNDTKEDVWFLDPQYFKVISSRSGSYYHDYEYSADEVYEVYPKIITKTIYVTKQKVINV